MLAIENAELFEELERKGRELEEASRHKSEFLANMSHELRTPLNAVLGYAELIQDGIYGDVPAKMGDVLERIQQNGRHLLGLINDVLDLSKIEAGQLTLSPVEYSMRELVLDVVSATEALASEKKLALEVDAPADLPRGRGDERRLTQVLLNLVSNAIKFTEAGSVSIRAKVEDGSFLVAVTDTGVGIAPEDRERIFEEFQQVDIPARARRAARASASRSRGASSSCTAAASGSNPPRATARPSPSPCRSPSPSRRSRHDGVIRMKRRQLAQVMAGLAGLSVLPFGRIVAQQAGRLPKVAFLDPSTPDFAERPVSALHNVLQALAELGYADGRNVVFDFRFASHALERLPDLAAELVAGQPDVMYTFSSGGARAAAAATSTIPIVVAPVAEETMAALVPTSLTRPGTSPD